MPRQIKFYGGLAALLCLPLLGMWLIPLADTSEPRYAEIARLMAQTGDWITPWFEPGVPFWGKPPLSFWVQALSFRLLGVNEFAARLPSWLATMGTVGLLYAHARAYFGARVAQWAVAVYGSCALVYVASGAVLTDPFLALGTTWSMTAFAMAARKPTFYWRYGFFLGLAIGLLAKGPLALVLVASPLLAWLPWRGSNWQAARALPWGRGSMLTLAISLPWYVLAELKTPGFLNYFIAGEHFLRFVDPGWQGDLYGTAHKRAYGAIWWYWLQAAFPWGVVALGMIAAALFKAERRDAMRRALRDPALAYLLAWSLFAPLFFTVSGNILWTYVLPALGAFSILLAVALDARRARAPVFLRRVRWLACLAPATILLLTVVVALQPARLKTERGLVRYAQQMGGRGCLFYVDSRPFSARFYSRGEAGLLGMEQLPAKLGACAPVYLAVPRNRLDQVAKMLARPLRKRFESQRYVLIEIDTKP
ncbi:ArnT family glycosyltransferase [Pollutimonas bauzanensis]|uniref:Dolichyl-phosphate-mannose-protein mannosyltransferase n=1 Tax=Pollutimonas bauzanensis TaxID=658167 RepID=A0A1M5WB31_9BURK|nr:glycosyltransferase family 39 protein [Pollutimonas bauzanensis]SHH84696.1 Dolichyl-phosphate-mannose-protein mannosyltransferase [Pollutimonas bauzanensis]